MRKHRAGKPGGVGEELARGTVFEPSTLFQIADRELDPRVVTVERVCLNCVEVDVGDKAVVTPVRPQRLLANIGEPGATHDESKETRSSPALGDRDRLSDEGDTAVGIADLSLGRLLDCVDEVLHTGGDRHRDREGHLEALKRVDERVGEKA